MKDWITNFGAQIGFEGLSKTGFLRNLAPIFPQRKTSKKRFRELFGSKFSHDDKITHWETIHSTKKSFFAVLEFSILRSVKGENANFGKIRIFKYNPES